MNRLARRVGALESLHRTGPYDAFTDEQLAERIAELDARLEAAGIIMPPGFDRMPSGEQRDWFERIKEGVGGL